MIENFINKSLPKKFKTGICSAINRAPEGFGRHEIMHQPLPQMVKRQRECIEN